MARTFSATDRAIDKAIVDAIKAFLLTYNQTKLAGSAGVWSWSKAERAFVKRMVLKNQRGATGFGGDISNINQVP
jgi:hypothetical protein